MTRKKPPSRKKPAVKTNSVRAGVTLWHNPRCATSRKVLKMLTDRGIEPEIFEYLEKTFTRKDIIDLINLLGVDARQILRKKEARAAGLNNPKLDLTKLIDKIAANPIVIERPIVITAKGAKICRPPETVEELI